MAGRACRFRTIEEYWYVLSGEGEVWRKATDGRESITRLVPGVCIDISLGTAFQYRCTGDVPLVFTCTALPPWPGDDEALIMDGPWTPSAGAEPEGLVLGLALAHVSFPNGSRNVHNRMSPTRSAVAAGSVSRREGGGRLRLPKDRAQRY